MSLHYLLIEGSMLALEIRTMALCRITLHYYFPAFCATPTNKYIIANFLLSAWPF